MLLDVTLIIMYMLFGVYHMLDERQVVMPLWWFVFMFTKKKKKFRRSKWYQSSSSRVCLEKRKPRVELESKEQENLGILIAYNQDKKT